MKTMSPLGLLLVVAGPAGADDLQSYLECSPDLPEAYGVLSDPAVASREIDVRSEMNGGWTLTLKRQRQVYGEPVKRLRAYIGEHLNYRIYQVPKPIERVRDRLADHLGQPFTAQPLEGDAPIREKVKLESTAYYAGDIHLYAATGRRTWVVCHSDRGTGDAEAP